MKVAVITGASSGLGVEFALALDKFQADFDEIWLIARRKERLEEISKSITHKTRVIPMDITDEKAVEDYEKHLSEENADVVMLINNAGFGKLGAFEASEKQDAAGMIKLNCEALTVFTLVTLKFMDEYAQIINSCSIASFAPNTNMAVYSSTKAYVMSFSRALREELRWRKINVLAACPGPMDTEFLSIAGISKGRSKTFDTLPRVNAKEMAEKSLIASRQNKAVYTNKAFYKFYRILAKILPHSLVMKLAGT